MLPGKQRIIEEIGSEQEVEIIVPSAALTETYVQISVFGKDGDGGLLTSTQVKLIIYPSGLNENVVDEILDEEVFVLEDLDEDEKLKRLQKDIFWFIPNKKLLNRKEHLYD